MQNVTGATNMTVVMSASVVKGAVNTTKATNATAITNVTSRTGATGAIVTLSYLDCKVIFPSSQVLVHHVQQLQQTKHVQLLQLV